MRHRRRTKAGRRGFSLIESLISLVLSLAIILAGIELFGTARGVFFKLESAQTGREGASAALEKIKSDLKRAGRNMSPDNDAASAGGIEASGTSLILRWRESEADAGDVQVVTYYLDAGKAVLRRRAGAGVAQPLLEGVASFGATYDLAANIVEISIRLESDTERTHGLEFFPKNMAIQKSRL